MMTIADKLEREFGLIKRDGRGFADYDLLDGFRGAVRSRGNRG